MGGGSNVISGSCMDWRPVGVRHFRVRIFQMLPLLLRTRRRIGRLQVDDGCGGIYSKPTVGLFYGVAKASPVHGAARNNIFCSTAEGNSLVTYNSWRHGSIVGAGQ